MIRKLLAFFFLFAGFRGVCNNQSAWSATSDSCATAVDLSSFFHGGTGAVQTTGTFDNTLATADVTDPAPSCFDESGTDAPVNNSLWFTFMSDGGFFHIETVPCNAGPQYISGGDTQMAVFQGNNCDNLISVACNEDLYHDNNPVTDFRAGLDLETIAGQKYYLMIDGYTSGGITAKGRFCIQITRIEAVTCEDAAAGTFEIGNNGFLCKGANLLNTLTFDAASFVIPVNEPLAGMSWVMTAQPIPEGVWPGSIPGVMSTPLSSQVLPLNMQNNFPSSVPTVFYLTPVVIGGATLINPEVAAKLPNLDVSAGCYELGATKKLTLVPTLEPLEGIATAVAASPGQNNGGVLLQVEGGYPELVNTPSLYKFLWNTGDTTSYLSGVGPGTYTVTIADPTGCTGAISLTADVTVPVREQHLATTFLLHPNPAKDMVTFTAAFPEAAEVEIELLNTLGQLLQRVKLGKINNLDYSFDLKPFNEGVYIFRVIANGQSATKRILLQP